MANVRSLRLLLELFVLTFLVAAAFSEKSMGFVGQILRERADVAISQKGPDSVKPGETALYTLTVRNAGPRAAGGVLVSDVLPPGVAFDPAQSDPSCVAALGIVTCGKGEDGRGFILRKDETKSFVVAIIIPKDLGCKAVVSNTALVQALGTFDPRDGDNVSIFVLSPSCPTGPGPKLAWRD